MKRRLFFVILLLLLPAGQHAFADGAWERHCEACHDGQTVLNGKVVAGREQLKAKYVSLQAFVNACGTSPSCMNILKHDENLLRQAGRELGLRDAAGK